MKRHIITLILSFSIFHLSSAMAQSGGQAVSTQPAQQAVNFNNGKSGQLTKLDLPDPEKFTTKDGRKGWKIKIPGGRPLATPAVVGGTVFIGGGFGSHEFYALDAGTGARVWTFKTGDDGPTAAVVAEGCVAYNTESCTIYIHDSRTGEVLWNKWLGDPLMSQPAIGGGRLFMAYPAKGTHHLAAFELKTGKVLWDQEIDAEVISAPVLDGDFCFLSTCNGTVYCFDQATGKLYWKKECNATAAPVIVDKKVYFSQRQVKTVEVAEGEGKDAKKVKSEMTVEGFNYIDPKSGDLAYKEPRAAVKAGYLLSLERGGSQLAGNMAANTSGQNYLYATAGKGSGTLGAAATQPSGSAAGIGAEDVQKRLDAFKKRTASAKLEDGKKAAEEALTLADDVDKVAVKLQDKSDQGKNADDLKKTAGELRQMAQKVKDATDTAKNIQDNLKANKTEIADEQAHDTSVAFGSAPAAAKLGEASANLGKGNVKSIWAFQGSRPLPFKDAFIAIQGDQFRSVTQSGEKVLWDNKLASKVDATRSGTPPAMAGAKVYFGTADGRVVCADPATGKTLWESEVGGNIRFQPAVVGGKVFVATDAGTLICLDADDAKADGWTMWGGSSQHNGPAEETKTTK